MRILALSACDEKQLGPDSGTADGPEIRFGVSEQGSGTKALIEANGLAVAGTQLHVFDILTGFVGSVGTQTSDGTTPITYIDKTIGYDGSAWPFVTPATNAAETPAYYRWTKTGTHTFFGYLTKDPDGNSLASPTMGTDKKLTVGPLSITPTTNQVDFLYSNIITRDAATGPYTPIQLSMKHLFTALAVEVSNQTGVDVTGISVSFSNIQNGRTATIDYAGNATPSLTDGTKSSDYIDFGGDVTDVAPVTSDSFTSLYSVLKNKYRLLWPQDDISASMVKIEYTVNERIPDDTEAGYHINPVSCSFFASLEDVFKQVGTDTSGNPTQTPVNEMVAGKKYLLQIKIKPVEVLFNIQVFDLVNVNADAQSTETFYVES